MAHTDACKIQVCQFVEKLTEEGMSINQACKETEIESDGIPAETIRYWWKQIQKETEQEVGENSPTSEQPPVTPQPDSETQDQSSSEETQDETPTDQPTHGGKREGAGAPEKKEPRKKNYNRFWASIANQINKLANRISDKGGFPIKENAKQETINELIDALNLINEFLKGVR